MNLVYVDESGNTGLNLKDPQQPVFVLAAIIIPSEKWFELERSFNEILSCYFNPVILENFELHASDLCSRRGSCKDLTPQQAISLRNDILNLIKQNNIPLIYTKIIKGRFEKYCEKNYGPGIKIDPYVMALPFVCIEVDNYLRNKGRSELGMIIFDEQNESYDEVEKSIRTLRLDPDSSLKTTRIIEKGFFVDSAKSFGIQMTDLIAYYVRKYEEAKINIRVNEIHKQTFEIIEQLAAKSGTSYVDILEWVKSNVSKK